MFVIGKIVGALLVPPGLFVTLGALALAFLLSGRRKPALAFLTGLIGLALLLSMTPVADLLISPLENRYRPLVLASIGADSAKEGTEVRNLSGLPVVALGGGFQRSAPGSEGYGRLKPESMTRAYFAARLAGEEKGLLVFTGGSLLRDRHGGTEADAASRLWIEMGIDPSRIRLERDSIDTYGNAQFVKTLVGTGPVILVTSAWHMPRAMLAFKKAGIIAIAAPCAYRSESEGYDFMDWLPGMTALQSSAWAIHEYIGLLWYSIVPAHPAPLAGGGKAGG